MKERIIWRLRLPCMLSQWTNIAVGVHQKENTITRKNISVRRQLGHEGNLLIIGGFCYHASSIPYGCQHQNENMIPHKSPPNTYFICEA